MSENRITKIDVLRGLKGLEEIYMSQNMIETMQIS
jgi:Leucine-rich repeat (LRR) protein